jgi:threonine dehydrogenase-like Zn-dependent dehydrogenase
MAYSVGRERCPKPGFMNVGWKRIVARQIADTTFLRGGNIMNAVVVVVIGAGGIGIAIARRQGFGKHILLADFNEELLETAARELEIPLTLKSSPSNRSTRPTRGS